MLFPPEYIFLSFPSSRSQFSGVPSLGRGKGTKEEAGISLLGLSEQSVTDSVACTTESHFILLKNIFLIHFGCTGCLLLHRLFSSCGEWQLLSSCGAQASHCGGFSCCRARVLGHTVYNSFSSQVLEHRLNSCGAWGSCFAACETFSDQGSNLCLLH